MVAYILLKIAGTVGRVDWRAVTDVGIVASSFVLFNQYWSVHQHVVFIAVFLLVLSRFLASKTRFALTSWPASSVYFFLGFLAWILLSTLWSPTLHMSVSYALLAALAGVTALLLGAVLELRTVALGIMVAVLGLALHVFVTGSLSFVGRDSGWGLYTNPSSLTFVLGVGVVAIFFSLGRNRGSWAIGGALIVTMLTWLVGLSILTGIFALAGAVVVGLGVFHVRRSAPSAKRFLAVVYPSLFATAGLLFWFFREPILRPLGEDPTLSARVPLWEGYFEAVLWRPWVGSGWGSTVGWDFPLDPERLTPVVEWFPAHNGFIDIALMLGFVGLILFLGAWASLLWASLKVATSQGFSWRYLMIPVLIAYLSLNDLMATSLPKLIGIFLVGLMIGQVAAVSAKIESRGSPVARGSLSSERPQQVDAG